MPDPLTLDLQFSVELDAADTDRRIITGTAVPYGAFGATSVGPAAFLSGAFSRGAELTGRTLDASSVTLVREHDDTAPLGRAVELDDTDERMVARFRVARTTAGDDALVEAAEGLRAGLSVGARALEYEHDDDGRLLVTAAELRHVGLVTRPAYEAATVSNVAASRHDDDQEVDDMPNPTSTETAPTVDAAQLQTAVDAAVTAALTARDDQALEVSASNPPEPAAGRRIEVNEPSITAAAYCRAVVLASQGDTASQELVTAALETAGTGGHTGVVPTPMLGDIIEDASTGRPTIDALTRRDLPEAGMKFELPRWATKPTTGQGAESTEIVSTASVIDELAVDVVRISGGNRVSVELVERSSPAYLDELIRVLVEDFRERSNLYALERIKAGAGTSDGPTLNKAYSRAKGDAFSNGKRLATHALGSTDAWVELDGAEDDNGRPIFAAMQPSNAAGDLGSGPVGVVKGLQFAPETGLTGVEQLVLPRAAANYYEQPGAPVTVRMMQVSTLEWEVAVYGFLATAVKHPLAVRSLTVTEPT